MWCFLSLLWFSCCQQGNEEKLHSIDPSGCRSGRMRLTHLPWLRRERHCVSTSYRFWSKCPMLAARGVKMKWKCELWAYFRLLPGKRLLFRVVSYKCITFVRNANAPYCRGLQQWYSQLLLKKLYFHSRVTMDGSALFDTWMVRVLARSRLSWTYQGTVHERASHRVSTR
jgi:hypothetical protein